MTRETICSNLFGYTVPKTIDLKCSSLNGYNFGISGPFWTRFGSYELERLGLSNGVNKSG